VDGIWGSKSKEYRRQSRSWRLYQEQCQSFNSELKIKLSQLFRRTNENDLEFSVSQVTSDAYSRSGNHRWRKVWAWI
jgi:hypothetical protein